MTALIEITDANFEQKVLREQRPTVLAFLASWNAPSKDLIKNLERAALSMESDVLLGRVNVDDSPMISSQYGLPTLPCLLMIHERQIIEQRIGAIPRADLDAFLERASKLEATPRDTLAP